MWYYDQFILDPRDVFDIINYRLQGYILRKILWPGGGEWCRGKKIKTETEGKRGNEKEGEKRKRKRRKGKERMIFFCLNMAWGKK